MWERRVLQLQPSRQPVSLIIRRLPAKLTDFTPKRTPLVTRYPGAVYTPRVGTAKNRDLGKLARDCPLSRDRRGVTGLQLRYKNVITIYVSLF